jgi:hypothetical protein
MSRPEPMKLGPFSGGMNTYSDPSSIDENELVDCLNMELDMDGSLVCRPIIRQHTATHSGSPWTTRLKVIGQGVWETTQVLFGSNPEGLWYLDSKAGPWKKIAGAGSFEMRASVQCGKSVCFIPASATRGGYWNPTAGWIADDKIPPGNSGVYFKGRLWVVPGPNPPQTEESRVTFTDPIISDISSGSKPVWDGPVDAGTHLNLNNIDVSRGDGQDLIEVKVYLDQLLLFKQDSTYVLAYDGAIDQALLRCINTEIGATSRVCVATYEDVIYTFHQGRVYEISNYQFTQINEKVPFVIDQAVPAGKTRGNDCYVCVIEDRLLVRYFNRVYMYGLLTRTWSRWQSVDPQLQNFGYLRLWPFDSLRNEPKYYYAGSVLTEETMIFEWIEGRGVNIFETVDGNTRLLIDCTIITKTLDLDDPFNFKKLAWWGIDCISNRNVTAIARPINVFWESTWETLSNQRWNQLLTWSHPTDTPYYVEDIVIDNSAVLRKFYKLKKALRFRLINFSVKLQSDGSTQDGPARLFTIIPWIGQKEHVVKQVS